MKTKLLTVLMLTFIGLGVHAQSNFQDEYQRFLDNQRTPFLAGSSDVFVLDGIAWERLYGEKEYALMPTTYDRHGYNSRIRSQDNPSLGITKSKFQYVRIPVTDISRALLLSCNILVPSYAGQNVIVYLPQIDVDFLVANQISVYHLIDYGTNRGSIQNNVEVQAVIWSEGFETNAVPGSVYDAANYGAANCGWGDENCAAHSGSWSVWCALNGPACNSCGGSTVSDMDADFEIINAINTAGYVTLTFSYWKWQDLNDAETADYLERWTDLGSGWVLSATYYSNSADDEAGWVQKTATYSGVYPSFAFAFTYWSDGSWNADGIYLDDLQLSGTPTSVDDMNFVSNVNVYPNPSNGQFTLELSSEASVDIELNIQNVMGQVVYSENLPSVYGDFKKQLDLNELAKGVYLLQLTSAGGMTSQKIVIE